MSLSRRAFLKSSGVAAGSLAFTSALTGTAFAADEPTTAFEQNGGSDWTGHNDELSFLETVANTAPNAIDLSVIGTTAAGRPLHLVRLGVADTLAAPTLYVVGSQHGNEPAGREACLKLLRDLAFTTDEALLALLAQTSIIITPSANPDGRAANRRTNDNGFDINRDHLNLETEEAQALARVHNTWRPNLVVDHHEYSGTPVTYDDDVTFLWPRNLNADDQVRELAKTFCFDYIQPDCYEAGFTADEYGQRKVGPYVGPVDATSLTGRDGINRSQTAGDEDDGIARNAMGLRHSMGILIESYTGTQAYRTSETSSAGRLNRRVDSQRVCMDAELRFMAEMGAVALDVCSGAGERKAAEGADQSAPVYFYGADNDAPTASDMQDPAPLRYRLTAAQAAEVSTTLALHGVSTVTGADGDVLVSLAQRAEPVVPLLLDERARRSAIAGTPEYA